MKDPRGGGGGGGGAAALDWKLRRNYYVVLGLGIGGIGLMCLENARLRAASGESDAICEALKLLTSFLTAWQLLFLYLFYRRKFEQDKMMHALLHQDTFVSSGLLWRFVGEAALTAIHAPPFWNTEVELTFYRQQQQGWGVALVSTDELATIAMAVLRLPPLIVRLLAYLAGTEGVACRSYGNMNFLNLDAAFSTRVLLRRYPVTPVIAASLSLICLLASSLQTFERRANPPLDDFGNAAWLVFSCMIGAGFGDFVPLTLFGRVACAVAMVWGVLLMALFVQSVLQLSALSTAERRVSSTLEMSDVRRQLKQRAARYVQAAWASYLERLHRSHAASQGSPLLAKEPLRSDARFCRAMRRFRSTRKESMSANDPMHNLFKEVLDSRTRAESRLRDIEEKIEELDAKFEHNIAAMNDLLQKNLKYLKHVAS